MAVKSIHVLFRRPAEVTVVKDEVRAVFCAYCVSIEEITVDILIADTKTDIAYYEVLRTAEIDFVMCNHDT